MLAAPSFHFKIDLSGERVVLNELTQLVLRSAEGDFARPDRMGVHLKVIAAVAAAELDMIAFGNEQYLTNILTQQWEVLPPEFGFNPAVMFDPKVGIGAGVERRHRQSRNWSAWKRSIARTSITSRAALDGARVQGMSGGLIGTARRRRKCGWTATPSCRAKPSSSTRQQPGEAHDLDADVCVVWQDGQHRCAGIEVVNWK